MFIDNSALSHGGSAWLEMTEDGGPDALSFAFVAIIQGTADVRTMGMHVLGLRDLAMKRADADADDRAIIEMIRYLARGDKPVDDGHVSPTSAARAFRSSRKKTTRFRPKARCTIRSAAAAGEREGHRGGELAMLHAALSLLRLARRSAVLLFVSDRSN